MYSTDALKLVLKSLYTLKTIELEKHFLNVGLKYLLIRLNNNSKPITC